jgi:hypothetical protein
MVDGVEEGLAVRPVAKANPFGQRSDMPAENAAEKGAARDEVGLIGPALEAHGAFPLVLR